MTTAWPFWLSALGLAAGAAMGAYGLVSPRWAAALVRLRDIPEKPGGFAEFRGTYGGLFLGSHAAALALMVAAALRIEAIGGVPTHGAGLGAVTVCGAIWIGTGIGRVVSIVLDGTGTRFNRASAGFEVVLGLAILAPWMAH